MVDEDAFAVAFVCPSKRERVRGSLRSKKGRAKFLSQLYHFSDFDPRLLTKIDASQQRADSILNLLNGKGAGRNCYLISASSELDRMTGSLGELLTQVVGFYAGTVILCVPGRLAYYEGEEQGERYLLERGAS